MTARKVRVPRRLRERVAQAARHRCGYCRTPESIVAARSLWVQVGWWPPAAEVD